MSAADQLAMGRCPFCGDRVAIEAAGELWRRCDVCDTMVFRRATGATVLIAHESEPMCQQLGAVLLADAFHPVRAADGAETLFLLSQITPAAAVLDVGLPRINTFEVIERLREDPVLGAVKIIILASVFNKTAYKRRPTSLYGADDYVEQHHIPDLLPAKLSRLLGRDPAAVSSGMRATISRIAAAHERPELHGIRRVRALAQAIVADIALYHETEINEAIGSGQLSALQGPLAEGRRILAELATDDDYPSSDPIEEAFAALLDSLRAGHKHASRQ